MAANIPYFGDKLNFISRRGNEARVFLMVNWLLQLLELIMSEIIQRTYAPYFKMIWVLQSILLEIFHPNLKRDMTLIQTSVIKNGGTTSTLIMQQSQ